MLQRKVRLVLREDNQATIKVVRQGYSAKLRHMPRTHRIDLRSLSESLERDSVELEYVETNLQRADIFTKALPPHKWDAAVGMLNIRTTKRATRGGA